MNTSCFPILNNSGIRLNIPPFRRIFPINKGGGKLSVLTKSFIKIFRFAENKGEGSYKGGGS